MNSQVSNQLKTYVDALRPIIYINYFDFSEVDEIIKKAIGSIKKYEYIKGVGVKYPINNSDGNGLDQSILQSKESLFNFLNNVKDEAISIDFDEEGDVTEQNHKAELCLVLKNVHNELADPEVIGLLQDIADRHTHDVDFNCTIIIVSSILVIPKELENYITVLEVPYPSLERIAQIIEEFDADAKIKIDKASIDELSLALKGLSEYQIIQILNLAYQDGGRLTVDDKKLILQEKEQLIKKAGMLELIPFKENINEIGGLKNLKLWLKSKAYVFEHLNLALKFGVDIPKGVMIVGMPGCGKSLTAKATASLFGLPLVRLDVGKLLGRYVGESENNMRQALRLSEAISPCVLWVDEIEKAFSGIGANTGGGNEITTRLFGQFLTWLQEKQNSVFVVATANDITGLPPEFLRKGRFDELFRVDLPSTSERKKIFKIHLQKRRKWRSSIDLDLLAESSKGYSGADIESVVKDCIEKCFVEGNKHITTEDLQDTLEHTKSISESLKNKINEYNKMLNDLDLKSASKVSK